MTTRFPWPHFKRPLTLSVLRVNINGVAADVVDDHLQRVLLNGIETDWEVVELDIELSTVETSPGAITGAARSAHAMLSSSVTNSRIPVRLEEVATNRWRGRLRAQRAELGGAMTLEAYVTAADADSRPLLRGTSLPWTVVLDQGIAPAAPTRTPVASVWVDFTTQDAPSLCRAYASAPYAVVLEGAKPVLYLNSGQKHFQKLLLNEHAQLERRRLRDTFSTVIAADVTRALVHAAFDELVTASEGSDTVVPPQEALSRQSCEAVADVMQSVSDVQDLYRRMFASQASLTEARALWSELELAIGELVSLNQNIVSISEEVR